MNKCNLILHCGAQAVERPALEKTRTPVSTPTWTPIPHHRLVEQVEHALSLSQLSVVGSAHALSHGGNRYFGLLQIQQAKAEPAADYSWVLGLRNSHDKTFPASLVVGWSVFVCDNLSFSGEVQLSRKHTANITRDLPLLTVRAVGQLTEKWHTQDIRIRRYRESLINDPAAHDLMIRAVDAGVLPVSTLPKVIREWRAPAQPAFAPRNVWSLFNAFTDVLKGNLAALPFRTQALHGLMDSAVGLAGRN